MTDIQLAPQQLVAEQMIMDWLKDDTRQVFVLAGYAGTGKTTMNRKLAQNLENRVTFAAFTGKAVNILREKGCPNVDTIHALLYKPVAHDKTKLHGLMAELDNAKQGNYGFSVATLSKEIEQIRKDMRQPKFELNDNSGGNLIIVDEYSMLPQELINDILRKYKKVLFTGDPFQLPPVKGSCSLEPDYFLTEIHRQALESAIVRMSKDIRENQTFTYGDYGDFLYLPQSHSSQEMYQEADQIITGQNATRCAINQWIRQLKGINRWLPIAGEKLICLKNNKKQGLFNGMICTALEDAHKREERYTNYMLRIDTLPAEELSVWEGDIMGRGSEYDWNDWTMKSHNRFDFAYAITCHKSQGSEFKTVVVYNEPIGADDLMKRRWLYTAITRGKERVTLVQPGG